MKVLINPIIQSRTRYCSSHIPPTRDNMMLCSLIDLYMFWRNVLPQPSALNSEAEHSSKTSVSIYQTKHHCTQKKTVILNHPVDGNPQLSTYFYFLIHTIEKEV
jgi:hypothetical protein